MFSYLDLNQNALTNPIWIIHCIDFHYLRPYGLHNLSKPFRNSHLNFTSFSSPRLAYLCQSKASKFSKIFIYVIMNSKPLWPHCGIDHGQHIWCFYGIEWQWRGGCNALVIGKWVRGRSLTTLNHIIDHLPHWWRNSFTFQVVPPTYLVLST